MASGPELNSSQNNQELFYNVMPADLTSGRLANAHVQISSQETEVKTGKGSLASILKYKTFILVGLGILVVLIATLVLYFHFSKPQKGPQATQPAAPTSLVMD